MIILEVRDILKETPINVETKLLKKHEFNTWSEALEFVNKARKRGTDKYILYEIYDDESE